MRTFFRLFAAEFLKLRRSPALRIVWLLPLLFVLLEFSFFERPALGMHTLSLPFSKTFDRIQIELVGALWSGFFHPLMIALVPALLFRPEHRFKIWRHLHSMPVSRRAIFLAKALLLALLCAGSLALVGGGLWLERSLIGRFNPLLAFPFHGMDMARVLGWLWLGSLPLLALYLWVSDRINSLAVPIVFGLLGLVLTIALSGADLPKPWRRDLNPWVLPYVSAQQAIKHYTPRQTVHAAGKLFQEEPDILRLPNGKKVRTWQNVPDDVLFPPAPPTPRWMLCVFSLISAAMLLSLGVADAGRTRS